MGSTGPRGPALPEAPGDRYAIQYALEFSRSDWQQASLAGNGGRRESRRRAPGRRMKRSAYWRARVGGWCSSAGRRRPSLLPRRKILRPDRGQPPASMPLPDPLLATSPGWAFLRIGDCCSWTPSSPIFAPNAIRFLRAIRFHVGEIELRAKAPASSRARRPAQHTRQHRLSALEVCLRIYADRVPRRPSHIDVDAVIEQTQLLQPLRMLDPRRRQRRKPLQQALAISIDSQMLAISHG